MVCTFGKGGEGNNHEWVVLLLFAKKENDYINKLPNIIFLIHKLEFIFHFLRQNSIHRVGRVEQEDHFILENTASSFYDNLDV